MKIFPMNHFKLFSSVCPFQVHILTHEYHFFFVCVFSLANEEKFVFVVYEIRCCWRENNNFFCQNAINFFIPSSRVQYECGYSAQSIYISYNYLRSSCQGHACYTATTIFFIYFINSDSCHRQQQRELIPAHLIAIVREEKNSTCGEKFYFRQKSNFYCSMWMR